MSLNEGIKNTKRYLWGLALLVGALSLTVYLPTLEYQFVNWDDGEYVYKNTHIRSLDFTSINWMFTAFHSANWHPITWLSHAIDYSVWGLNPKGHHLTNIILHGFNTALVVILVHLLLVTHRNRHQTIKADYLPLITAGLAGLLFGLHPLHVESVAWVSERKDLLCAFFFLSTLIAYLKYASLLKQKGAIKWYCLSLICFLFALLSKPMAVTLPAVLLILDGYPLARLNLQSAFSAYRNVLIEKLPFILLAIASVVITLLAQDSFGALSPLDARPIETRLLVAVQAICFYLLKMFVPTGLSPLYPYPETISLFSVETIGSIAAIIGLTAVSFFSYKKQPALAAGLAYYLITLSPVIGIIQVGGQAAADRYTYLPSLGPFILIALSVSYWVQKSAATREKLISKNILPAFLSVLVIFTLSMTTINQMAHWKNSITLWNRAISLYPDQSWSAYFSRAEAHLKLKKFDAAINDFTKVIQLNPYYYYGHYRRGASHFLAGNYRSAIIDFSSAIKLNDRIVEGFYYRGEAYRKLGEMEKANRDSTAAYRLMRSNPDPFQG